MADVLDKSVMKALSSDTRQSILKLLARRPYTASELAKLLNKHVTTISEHMESLEKSQLVRKKDSSNKWVYYALAPQGEKMFKPQYYSWTIMLVLSVVAIVVGAGGLLPSYGQRALSEAQGISKATEYATDATATAVDYAFVLPVALVVLGAIGIALYLWRRNSRKKIL